MKISRLRLTKIKIDTAQFQFRSDSFDEERVRWLVENWNPDSVDPLDVWDCPESEDLLLLSGHHRLEAMRRRGETWASARVHDSLTLEQAQEFALVSNANRLQYTPFELSRCVSHYIKKGRLADPPLSDAESLATAANALTISSVAMAKKYYALRHLVGTDWEAQCEPLDLLTRAFEVGQFIEKHGPLSPIEVQSLFKITVKNELTVSQLKQLFRDVARQKDEPSATGSLFDVNAFTDRAVKAIRERDFLNKVSAECWWIWRLLTDGEEYQFPTDLREPFERELKRLYAYCVGFDNPDEVVPQRASPKKARKLRVGRASR